MRGVLSEEDMAHVLIESVVVALQIFQAPSIKATTGLLITPSVKEIRFCDDGDRLHGELGTVRVHTYVRSCERLEVQFLGPTRLVSRRRESAMLCER